MGVYGIRRADGEPLYGHPTKGTIRPLTPEPGTTRHSGRHTVAEHHHLTELDNACSTEGELTANARVQRPRRARPTVPEVPAPTEVRRSPTQYESRPKRDAHKRQQQPRPSPLTEHLRVPFTLHFSLFCFLFFHASSYFTLFTSFFLHLTEWRQPFVHLFC